MQSFLAFFILSFFAVCTLAVPLPMPMTHSIEHARRTQYDYIEPAPIYEVYEVDTGDSAPSYDESGPVNYPGPYDASEFDNSSLYQDVEPLPVEAPPVPPSSWDNKPTCRHVGSGHKGGLVTGLLSTVGHLVGGLLCTVTGTVKGVVKTVL